MNSAWKQFLAVLGLNILITAIVAMAFGSYLFKEDPFLVAIPSVIALPALMLQPWFLVFALLPVGSIWGPIPTSIVTVLVYRRLDRGGVLERPKQLLRRVTKRGAMMAGATVAALALLGVFARHIDVPPIHREPPAYLQRDLATLRITPVDSRRYTMHSFLDSESVWRASVSESGVLALASHLKMAPVPLDSIPQEFFSMPPYWWKPRLREGSLTLSTTNFPMNGRGRDGWHALMMWSSADQLMYMWIKDNF